MLKNTILYFMISVFVLVSVQVSGARAADSDAQTSASFVTKSQNAGNQICPVSGDEIHEETKATYEYKGKIYNLCCSSCVPAFRNDPEKYIQIIEAEKNKK